MKKSIGLLVLSLLPTVLFAQAAPQAATGGQATMWAGGELSIYNPDWGCQSNLPFNCSALLVGPTAYFDFNWNKKPGAEGDAHWLLWHGPPAEKEASYLLAPATAPGREIASALVAGSGSAASGSRLPDIPWPGALKAASSRLLRAPTWTTGSQSACLYVPTTNINSFPHFPAAPGTITD